jgi:uncharacterized membrane protein
MAFDNARRRSLCKTITWRVVASTDTFLIAWLLTGIPLIAGGIAGLEIITKTFLYYIHERQWNKVRWGKLPNERATASWYRALFRASYRIRRKLNGEKKINRKRPRAN